jgi:hypothetical protein
MPENPVAADMCRRLEPQSAESAPQPRLCCTRAGFDELRLLSDIRAALPERTREGLRITRIASESLLRLLQAAPDSKWRGLSPHRLACMLRGCGVRPRCIRFRSSGRILRGYDFDELQSAFLMYLPTATSQA